MSDQQLIGFRVVSAGKADTFELRQVAEQCYRLLRSHKQRAGLFRVTRTNGREIATPIRPRSMSRVWS